MNFFSFEKLILEFSLPDGSTSVHRGLAIVFIYGIVEQCFSKYLKVILSENTFRDNLSDFHYESLKKKSEEVKISKGHKPNNKLFYKDVFGDKSEALEVELSIFINLYQAKRNAFAHSDDIKAFDITESDIRDCKNNALKFIGLLQEHMNSVANP